MLADDKIRSRIDVAHVFTNLGCVCMLIKIPNPSSIVTIDVPP